MSTNGSNAAIIVSLDGIVQDAVPGIWDWIYRADLQPDENMRAGTSGDFFTIYDFSSLATPVSAAFGNSLNPAVFGRTFTVSEQMTGINPPQTAVPDNPNISNFTVRLTGGGDVVPNPATGQVTLGTLVIKSTTKLPVDSFFGSLAQKKSDLSGVSNVGSLPVAQGVPEPGSVTMVLAGLAAFGALVLRRRRLD